MARPRKKKADQVKDKAAEEQKTPAPKRTTVLVAEDDAHTAAMMEAVLKNVKGWDVKVVDNGEDALKAVNEGWKPDLLVTDFGLAHNVPGKMNGLELADKVRDNVGVSLPFVMVTGREDDELKQEIQDRGGEYLAKPMPIEGFKKAITQAFANMGKPEPGPNATTWAGKTESGDSGPSVPGR